MITAVRVAASLIAGTTVFFAGVLGTEYAVWFHGSPADLLADPVLNAVRFGIAGALGLGSAFLSYPRAERMGQ